MEFGMVSLAFALAGGLVGALLCWLVLRGALVAARLGAASAAQLQAQHGATLERVRGLEQERAQLAERAARVPQLEQQQREAQEQFTRLQAEATRLAVDGAERGQKIEAADQRLRESEAALQRAQAEARALAAELQSVKEARVALEATMEAERAQIPQQLARLQEARAELSNHFKALAAEILEEKGRSFSELNQTQLGNLLNPLRERMNEFKAKVEEVHAKDLEQQATLKAELLQLKDLNRQMTEEAHGLAVALKGQSKKQGNWGELVLGNVLDRAGLCEGKDYRREVSFDTEEGRRRPDVVLSLPQNKHLVIDAKVSLNAYTRYVNAEEPVLREQALRDHVAAIDARIQELSDRRYFELPGLNTPEMVFMFVPIESAFVEALRADESLFQRAIERNILVATPTTLLTSLNIVRQLWRFEEQNAHTAALADRAAKVYAKLVGFVASMEDVGKQLDKARDVYGKAMNQLVTGKGNLINQAKDFEKLGVAVKAQLPAHLAEKASLELEFKVQPIEYLPGDQPPAD